MNYDAIIASAVREWSCAAEFQRLFANAEHTINQSQRDFHPNGWTAVNEWISRAHLHDRYVVWLVVAVEIAADGAVKELEKPQLYVVEVKALSGSPDEENAEWNVGCYEFEEGVWEQLVESGGDFAPLEFELTTDEPIKHFSTFWHDTRPAPRPEQSGGVALKAPLRYMS